MDKQLNSSDDPSKFEPSNTVNSMYSTPAKTDNSEARLCHHIACTFYTYSHIHNYTHPEYTQLLSHGWSSYSANEMMRNNSICVRVPGAKREINRGRRAIIRHIASVVTIRIRAYISRCVYTFWTKTKSNGRILKPYGATLSL